MSGKQYYNLKGFFYCPNQGKPLKSGRRTCHSMKPKNASIEANPKFFKEELICSQHSSKKLQPQ